MEKTRLTVGKYTVSIFSPARCRDCSVIYTHIPDESAEAAAELQGDTKFVLVSVEGVDWSGDLSPWPAPGTSQNRDDFAGGADAYLKELTKSIVPAVEERLGFSPPFRSIAGYSLAGLFAVYALYRTDLFSRVAFVSGALWYDGFLDFMKKNSPMRLPEKGYFSLGDREKKTGNRRLATVEECTAEAESLFRSLGTDTVFELNPGNHFMDVPERIAKGLRWIST
jgi:Predicted hydrolase of the alpha/beta superfamily